MYNLTDIVRLISTPFMELDCYLYQVVFFNNAVIEMVIVAEV